ncbi:uncharacterized protein LOC110599106 [Ictidomys tridecemlineatus]
MTSRKAFPLPLPAVPSSPPRNQLPPPGSGPTPPSLPLPLSSSQPGPNLVVLPRVPPPGAAFPSARSDTICQLHLDIAALSHTPGCQTPKGCRAEEPSLSTCTTAAGGTLDSRQSWNYFEANI